MTVKTFVVGMLNGYDEAFTRLDDLTNGFRNYVDIVEITDTVFPPVDPCIVRTGESVLVRRVVYRDKYLSRDS